MSDLTVRVRGANRLASTLRKAGSDLVEMKDANERVGAIVATQARSLAPKRSGSLAGSIRPARRARGVIVRTFPRRYAWVQEYGSPKRNIAPRAYMRRALAAKRDEAVGAYFAEMTRLIGKVKGDQ